MLIHELAARTGLAPHTIRFYEKEGLLDDRHIVRGLNNYRHYTEAAEERLGLIRRGQSAGFSLNEVKALLRAWDAGELPPAEQVVYLEQKLAELDRKIEEFTHLRDYLADKIERIHRGDDAEGRAPETASAVR